MSTVQTILRKASEEGCEKLAAEIWLANLLKRDRTWLFAHAEETVEPGLEQIYFRGIDQLLGGKPVAQLTGVKEFYGLPFMVNEQVLIPRPESELLVDLAKDFADRNYPDGRVTVADIGTGSGCILLAILKQLSLAKGIGVEISEDALEIARKNAENLKLVSRVQLIQGNLLEPLEKTCQIIVANLPYIGRDKFHFVADNVARYEPEIALYGGSDGLELYCELFEQLMNKSWRPALLAGEFGFGQEELMQVILQKYFADQEFKIIPDLAGIPRVFVVNFALNQAKN